MQHRKAARSHRTAPYDAAHSQTSRTAVALVRWGTVALGIATALVVPVFVRAGAQHDGRGQMARRGARLQVVQSASVVQIARAGARPAAPRAGAAVGTVARTDGAGASATVREL